MIEEMAVLHITDTSPIEAGISVKILIRNVLAG
jgi:hypothetical protein